MTYVIAQTSLVNLLLTHIRLVLIVLGISIVAVLPMKSAQSVSLILEPGIDASSTSSAAVRSVGLLVILVKFRSLMTQQ